LLPAILYSLRFIVGSFMTAVYLAVLSSKTTQKLSTYIPHVAVEAGLPQSSIPVLLQAIDLGTPEAMKSVPGINDRIQAAVGAELPYAYAAAYAYVYYAAVAVAGVGLIACFCVKNYDPYFTNHVPRQIYRLNQDEVGGSESEKQNPGAWGKEDMEKQTGEHVTSIEMKEPAAIRAE
jgi:hypothetical protein